MRLYLFFWWLSDSSFLFVHLSTQIFFTGITRRITSSPSRRTHPAESWAIILFSWGFDDFLPTFRLYLLFASVLAIAFSSLSWLNRVAEWSVSRNSLFIHIISSMVIVWSLSYWGSWTLASVSDCFTRAKMLRSDPKELDGHRFIKGYFREVVNAERFASFLLVMSCLGLLKQRYRLKSQTALLLCFSASCRAWCILC